VRRRAGTTINTDPDAADECALYCLDRDTMNLYDLADTEPITAFSEREAARLLEYMVGPLARGRLYNRGDRGGQLPVQDLGE
jgi:hypothetical protein